MSSRWPIPPIARAYRWRRIFDGWDAFILVHGRTIEPISDEDCRYLAYWLEGAFSNKEVLKVDYAVHLFDNEVLFRAVVLPDANNEWWHGVLV